MPVAAPASPRPRRRARSSEHEEEEEELRAPRPRAQRAARSGVAGGESETWSRGAAFPRVFDRPHVAPRSAPRRAIVLRRRAIRDEEPARASRNDNTQH